MPTGWLNIRKKLNLLFSIISIQFKIDILLVSETSKTFHQQELLLYSWIHIVSLTIYFDGKAFDGGTTLIIRSSIRHYEIGKYQREFLQATSIVVEDWNGYITTSAVYSIPKHAIKRNII
jgi:hypothetical protein